MWVCSGSLPGFLFAPVHVSREIPQFGARTKSPDSLSLLNFDFVFLL